MRTVLAICGFSAGFGLASLPQPNPIPRSADTQWGTLNVGDAVRVEMVNPMAITGERARIGEIPADFAQREPTDDEIGVGVWIVHDVDQIQSGTLYLCNYYVPVGEEAQLGYKADARIWRVPVDMVHSLTVLTPASRDGADLEPWFNMRLAHNGATP